MELLKAAGRAALLPIWLIVLTVFARFGVSLAEIAVVALILYYVGVAWHGSYERHGVITQV